MKLKHTKIILFSSPLIIFLLFLLSLPELFWVMLLSSSVEEHWFILDKRLASSKPTWKISYWPVFISDNEQNKALATICMAKDDLWKGKYYKHIVNTLADLPSSDPLERYIYVENYNRLKLQEKDIKRLKSCFREALLSKNKEIVANSLFLLMIDYKDFDYLQNFITDPLVPDENKIIFNYWLPGYLCSRAMPYQKFIDQLNVQKKMRAANKELVESADRAIKKIEDRLKDE